MSWRLSELREWCGGDRVGGGDPEVRGVSTDTRTLRAGDLFVAIRGEHHDGHAYLDEAVRRGAPAVLVSQNGVAPDVPALRVDDTVRALGALARGHRGRFAGPVVAITGSNGKTTTKEMCADVLAAGGVRARRSPGNLNNHIGLPLAVLALELDDGALVVELAMNHAGEIDALARIAQPDVGAITQVAAAHLGPLGSLDAIAAAKGELLDHLRPGGTAVLNADDPRVMAQRGRFAGACVRFGFAPEADFRAEPQPAPGGGAFRLLTPIGDTEVRLQLPGRHLVADALCAAAAAHATGRLGAGALEAMRRGLESFRGVAHRLALRPAPGGLRLLDDSYNSNPASARAALETLVGQRGGGRTLGVLGDMLELGDQAEALHAEVGRAAVELGVDALVAVGPLSTATADAARAAGLDRVAHVPDAEAALAPVREWARAGDVVLVKGSRGMRMERLTAALEAEPA